LEKEAYNDERIRRYILGSLSGEETEQYDELSFTDGVFAGRLQVIEDDLVDAYVQGELSGEVLERFNAIYLASPKRREKVRIARILQTAGGWAVVAENPISPEGSSTASSLSEAPEARSGWARRFFSFSGPALRFGLIGAAMLLLVAGAWQSFENLQLRNDINQSQAELRALQQREQELRAEVAERRSAASEKQKELKDLQDEVARLKQQLSDQSARGQSPLPEIVPLFLAPQIRGNNRIPTISLAANTDFLAIQAELESQDYPLYQAQLKMLPDGQIVWRRARLRPRLSEGPKSIVVSIRRTLFKPQTYILDVTGISVGGAREPVGSYTFRVVQK
jgi:TolA-binding protein